jgi:IS1 family transposase
VPVVFKQARLENLVRFTKIVSVGNGEDVLIRNKSVKDHVLLPTLIGGDVAIFHHIFNVVAREYSHRNWISRVRGTDPRWEYGDGQINSSVEVVHEIWIGESSYKNNPRLRTNISRISFPVVLNVNRNKYVVVKGWRSGPVNADDGGGRFSSYYSLGACGSGRITRILFAALDFDQRLTRYLGIDAGGVSLISSSDGKGVRIGASSAHFIPLEAYEDCGQGRHQNGHPRPFDSGSLKVVHLAFYLAFYLAELLLGGFFLYRGTDGLGELAGPRLRTSYVYLILGYLLFISGGFLFVHAVVEIFPIQRHTDSVSQKHLTSPEFSYYNKTMANTLSTEKQTAIIGSLCEGASIRSIERITGVHRDTIMRLGVRVGQGCTAMMSEQMRDLPCTHLEMDEIWGFIGKKERHVRPDDDPSLGDVWTFCAIDADTKLVPAFKVGKRDKATANAFMADISDRMRNRVQISTDGLRAYVDAIDQAFGGYVDYAQIVKTYGHEEVSNNRRYSAPEFVSSEKKVITGSPNHDLISTSYIERLNATTRLHMRRLTRLTLAFSKKFENFEAAVGLHFAYYNFVKRHNTLRMTPAMAAGVSASFWSVADLVKAAA